MQESKVIESCKKEELKNKNKKTKIAGMMRKANI
jgi:hypothetical protein